MSRAVVVGKSTPTSTAVSRSRKKPTATAGTSSMASLLGSPRTTTPGASKRKAASTSTVSTPEAGNSSAGTPMSPQQKRARKSLTLATSHPISTPPKAPRKSKAESSSTKKETPEKRLARFIASPSAATSERITRAFQHRLYLLDKKLVGEDPNSPTSCHFDVLGSTGNVYEVKLQQRPSCTCPDFPRSGLCKHILFVMLRVLKLDRFDPRVWQKALLTSELKELLEIAAISDGVLADQSVRQRFQEIQRSFGKLEADSAAAPAKTVQREITGDCPICYEGMDDGHGKAKEPVVFCKVCGNNVHRDCFEKWTRSKSSSGSQTTCIYCRAVWSESDAAKKGKIASEYVNLADGSETHQYESLEELYPESHQWIGFNRRRGRGRGRAWEAVP
ncbi:unnamed protein product [Calypogeia fissa]